jgi:hypothetical protein
MEPKTVTTVLSCIGCLERKVLQNTSVSNRKVKYKTTEENRHEKLNPQHTV